MIAEQDAAVFRHTRIQAEDVMVTLQSTAVVVFYLIQPGDGQVRLWLKTRVTLSPGEDVYPVSDIPCHLASILGHAGLDLCF